MDEQNAYGTQGLIFSADYLGPPKSCAIIAQSDKEVGQFFIEMHPSWPEIESFFPDRKFEIIEPVERPWRSSEGAGREGESPPFGN